jgi:hypothetical protein
VKKRAYRHRHIREQTGETWASRLLVCSPQTALQRLSADYMRQWIRWQPGVLFRYGCLNLPGNQETYLGGLTRCQSLFLLVPESLYEQRRRAVLLHLVSERLHIQEDMVLGAYCDVLEQKSADGGYQTGGLAWDAEAKARQVCDWLPFLAHRKEEQTLDWRWETRTGKEPFL